MSQDPGRGEYPFLPACSYTCPWRALSCGSPYWAGIKSGRYDWVLLSSPFISACNTTTRLLAAPKIFTPTTRETPIDPDRTSLAAEQSQNFQKECKKVRRGSALDWARLSSVSPGPCRSCRPLWRNGPSVNTVRLAERSWGFGETEMCGCAIRKARLTQPLPCKTVLFG